MTCCVTGEDELSKVKPISNPPELVVLRENLFDEVVEVGRTRDIPSLTVEQLNRWAHEGRNLFKRDGNILVKYRNYLARFYGHHY